MPRPRRWKKLALVVIGVVLVAAAGGLVVKARAEAHKLANNPRATRKFPKMSPADRGMPFENAAVVTSDGLRLVGWFVPSTNGAVVIALHGYKDTRGGMLKLAEVVHRHGYGVLIPSLRAHDFSDGELLTFGHHEMKDLDAWMAWLTAHAGVDPARIGLFGASMGGTIAIQFTSRTPVVKALVADCAFSSIEDTVETSVRHFTGLPPFPFAPMILFWMERETGVAPSAIDAKQWIPRISPRPVLLLQGGADEVISPKSGEWLYEVAGQPKELWFDPSLGHAKFLDGHPEEFERRISGFFDKYLKQTEGPASAGPARN